MQLYILVCTQEDGIYSGKTKEMLIKVKASSFQDALRRFQDIYQDHGTDPSTELMGIVDERYFDGILDPTLGESDGHR